MANFTIISHGRKKGNHMEFYSFEAKSERHTLCTFDFSVSTNVDKYNIIRTCAHECCHFLWFLKIKELYPDIPRREYDSPYNSWQYSEMVVDPILNSKEINGVIGVNERAYDSFYEIKDNTNRKI